MVSFSWAALRMARAGSTAMLRCQVVAGSQVSKAFSSVATTGDIHRVSFRSRLTAEDLPLRFSLALRRSIEFPTGARRRCTVVCASDDEAHTPETVNWSRDLANSVNLIGNLGRDVDVKYLDNNRVFARTSIAVNRGGTKADTPSWFELEFWDGVAESAKETLKKGAWVHVKGKVFVEAWVDAQEAKRTTTKVVVGQFNFVQSDGSARPTTLPTSAGAPEARQSDAAAPSPPPMSKDRLWQEYFADRSLWWDNRGKKLNPKAPDFKHKSTSEALWIESYNTPAWVKEKLAKLDSAKEQGPEPADVALRENVKAGKPKSSTQSAGWGDF